VPPGAPCHSPILPSSVPLGLNALTVLKTKSNPNTGVEDVNTRTKIKDLTRGDPQSRQEELKEAELELVTGGLGACTCPNTCGPCGDDDHQVL
jgi:hypothetical protein